MKKIITLTLFFVFLFLYNNSLLSQPPVWDLDNENTYVYRDLTDFSIISPQPKCTCNCDEMLKPGIKKTSGQADNELYLRGGYYISGGNWSCQEMNLNICACNGNQITQIDVRIPSDLSNECLNKSFRFAILNDDPERTVTYISPSFIPNNGQFTSLDFIPPIEPCSCRVVKIWICSDSGLNCSGLRNISVNFNILNENCIRTMILRFDYISSVGFLNQSLFQKNTMNN